MQEDNQTPQPQSAQPPLPPQQTPAYTVEQPVAPQTVFNPTPQTFAAQPAVPNPMADATGQASDPSQQFGAPAPDVPGVPAAPAFTPGQPFGAGTMQPPVPTPAMPTPQFTPGVMATKKHKLPLIAAIVGGVLVLAVGAFFALQVFSHSISKEDVSQARDASSSFVDAMYDTSSAVSASMSTSTSDELTSKSKLATTKLADAEKQYKILKASSVQYDGKVHEKFVAFDKKWGPFRDYLQANIKDMEALQPLLISMEADINDSLKTTPTTTAELSTYLTNFKKVIDDTTSEVDAISLTVAENKKIIEALQTFLTAASQDIAAAQSDLAAGKDRYTVANHMYDVSSAQYDFSDELYSIQNQISDRQNLLDPSDEFNTFQSALGTLYIKVNS